MPTIINIRQDPFERTPITRGESLNNAGGGYMNDFMGREFWRFVIVQQEVARILNLPELRQRLSEDGMTVVASTPEAFTQFLRQETAKYGRVIEAAGIKGSL